MFNWRATWLGERKMLSDRLTPREAKNQNDKRIVKNLWKLLNEADVVIAHNGDRFDLPKINARFLIHQIKPPSHYETIDTLKTARRKFGLTSNKLDYITK